MKPRVYLADLRYNFTGVLANDCMPLGVAYMKAVMDRDLPDVESRLFAYPDRLWEAISETPPDILMLSNYIWNEALGFHFAKLAKSIRPDTLVVMGGPNIPIGGERQTAYFESHPEIDIYLLGEADFLATAIVQMFLESGMSASRLAEMEIPSSISRTPDGHTRLNPMWDRKRSIEEIPSPWLTGIQDEFFDGKLAPMIETNRGCPFSCTFCVQGTDWYTKVNYFPMDRMREDLEYIAKRVHEVSPSMGTLRIVDANYGMFERDVEISGWIGGIQKRYGYPVFIDATTGKNKPERIVRSVEAAGGALVVYQAVQSLDPGVLKNIKRSNIKLDAYEKVMVHIRGRGLRSNSDLIVGLPGESLDSHLRAIRSLIEAGTNQMHNLQLVLLKGSELETPDTRKKFEFDTRFRVLPKNFGVYGNRKVLDVEEVVVATSTFSFDDYLETRKWHLISSVFWNDSWYEDAVNLALSNGVRRSEWFSAMLPALEASEGPAREFLDEFVREASNELFPDERSCVDFYTRDENFQLLLNGDIGDNLMYKYRAIASFRVWPQLCTVALDATRRLLETRRVHLKVPDFAGFWEAFQAYVRFTHADGATEDEILNPLRVNMAYDIPAWIAAGMSLGAISDYRLSGEEAFDFQLTDDGARELKHALQVWTTSIKGLAKGVTRIQSAWQRREAVRLDVGKPHLKPSLKAVETGMLPDQW